MDNIGKRMYRNLGDDTKAKISQSLRGRSNVSQLRISKQYHKV